MKKKLTFVFSIIRSVLITTTHQHIEIIDLTELERVAEESEPLIRSMEEMRDQARAENGETGYNG